jgi:hypothetical protein
MNEYELTTLVKTPDEIAWLPGRQRHKKIDVYGCPGRRPYADREAAHERIMQTRIVEKTT